MRVGSSFMCHGLLSKILRSFDGQFPQPGTEVFPPPVPTPIGQVLHCEFSFLVVTSGSNDQPRISWPIGDLISFHNFSSVGFKPRITKWRIELG